MRKEKLKDVLDFIPLIIIATYAVNLLWMFEINEINFLWQHIIGLCLLPVIFILMLWKHRIGVLVLGLTLLLGLVGIVSFNYAITMITVYHGADVDKNVPLFFGQPIFILWLVLHFLLSFRHYVGILTKKYWDGIKNNTAPNFD